MKRVTKRNILRYARDIPLLIKLLRNTKLPFYLLLPNPQDRTKLKLQHVKEDYRDKKTSWPIRAKLEAFGPDDVVDGLVSMLI